MGYNMKIAISSIYYTFFFSDKFAYLISYAESKARPPSAPNVVIWVFCPDEKPYHPRDLVIWISCPVKKAVSPT